MNALNRNKRNGENRFLTQSLLFQALVCLLLCGSAAYIRYHAYVRKTQSVEACTNAPQAASDTDFTLSDLAMDLYHSVQNTDGRTR